MPTHIFAFTERISLSTNFLQGNGDSTNPELSYDGRYTAFTSEAINLVPQDTNNFSDVFVSDRDTHTTTRVSVGIFGSQSNGASFSPSISLDGRYIAFTSTGSNLVLNDTNGVDDVFVYDRTLAVTERVSVSSFGVAGNNSSQNPSISGDGRYVVFSSDANNLVAGDTNGVSDIFLYDRMTQILKRISVSSSQNEGDGESVFPSISYDGRYVGFISFASNLVLNDTNGFADVFVYDTLFQTTVRASRGLGNTNTNDESFSQVSLSSDGRFVAYSSMASNIVVGDTNGEEDAFLFDQLLDTTELISRQSFLGGFANGSSGITNRAVSSSGQYITFSSFATNLAFNQDINGVEDVFVYDRTNHITTRVSIDNFGAEGNNLSGFSSISSDGMHVGFHSLASNLVSFDTNTTIDVFVYDMQGKPVDSAVFEEVVKDE